MKKRIISMLLVIMLFASMTFASAVLPDGAVTVDFKPENLTLTEVRLDDDLMIRLDFDALTEEQLGSFGGDLVTVRLLVGTTFGNDEENFQLVEFEENYAVMSWNASYVTDADSLYSLGLRACFQATTVVGEEVVEVFSAFSDASITNMEALEEEQVEVDDNNEDGTVIQNGLKSSEWAAAEVARAQERGLVSDRLAAGDLTKNASRLEFVEICVRMYIAMTGFQIDEPRLQPFTDCTDAVVIQAYQLGITTGTKGSYSQGNLMFEPNKGITREEAATMLARTYKKAIMPGWAIEVDGQFDFGYTMPTPFADDRYISAYAYQNVYYMSSHGVIRGVVLGGKTHFDAFSPASREQCLLFAVRILEKLVY